MSYYQEPTDTMSIKTPSVTPGLALGNMIEEVCEAFGANKFLVMGKCRNREQVFARWAIWRIMLSHGYSKVTCGRMIGEHHWSSVINGMRQMDHDLKHEEPRVVAGWKRVEHFVKLNLI